MRVLFIAAMVTLLAGCASNVMTDYNSATVFGNYTSWAYAPSQKNSGITSLDDARVRTAIERELSRKAMRQVVDTEADLLISWQIVPEERLEQVGVGLGFGFGRGNFGWGVSAPPPVREITEGKLVIELADRRNSEVIWRSASRRYLNESQSPETRRKLIDEVVAEMFSKYPPGLN
ncbi:DUF4136 domain-containing protein [Marinobacter halophilus]|uniref:DUF4136 domain-containing protein n=1 Tax=Marinobacter halophilus TaxID=1323740 RepID=A0A2T1KEK2_9GAMM|nr:DUF4136 domain-containing protein [Marinobacter halophilus]PSF07972.1 DUF4136 domain-containing protein [Marinobacter halophilus]GGC58676.1 hypothetical protein GCM10011362_03860 [Marinobacter halophilus]